MLSEHLTLHMFPKLIVAKQNSMSPDAYDNEAGEKIFITAIPGISPRLDFPLAWSGRQHYELTVSTAPFDFYLLQAGFGRVFLDLSQFLPIDMVALVDPGASFSVGSGLVGPTGTVALSALAPDGPAAWGGAMSLQVVVLRATAARPFLLGNVRDLFFVP